MMSTPKTNLLCKSGLPFIPHSKTTFHQVAPAPTVNIQVTTSNGRANVDILTDSRADICCVAGPDFNHTLGEHMNNLVKSDVTPGAVNDSLLHPVGNLTLSSVRSTFRSSKTYRSSATKREKSWSAIHQLRLSELLKLWKDFLPLKLIITAIFCSHL